MSITIPLLLGPWHGFCVVSESVARGPSSELPTYGRRSRTYNRRAVVIWLPTLHGPVRPCYSYCKQSRRRACIDAPTSMKRNTITVVVIYETVNTTQAPTFCCCCSRRRGVRRGIIVRNSHAFIAVATSVRHNTIVVMSESVTTSHHPSSDPLSLLLSSYKRSTWQLCTHKSSFYCRPPRARSTKLLMYEAANNPSSNPHPVVVAMLLALPSCPHSRHHEHEAHHCRSNLRNG